MFNYINKKIEIDDYVGINISKKFEILNKIKIFNELRYKFWTDKAKAYKPFQPYYSRVALEEILLNNEIDSNIKNILMDGSAEVSNFADDINFFNKVKDYCNIYIHECQNKTIPNRGYFQSKAPEWISESLIRGLKNYYQFFFPDLTARMDSVEVHLRYEYSETGKDISLDESKWHFDRFIPTLNAIWFPLGARWACFEKVIGSPIIDGHLLRVIQNSDQGLISDYCLNELLSNQYHIKKYNVPENTLIIGSHHMPHRRSPYNSPGERLAIFIVNYNYFTRSDL
jgi:hypothetical protein